MRKIRVKEQKRDPLGDETESTCFSHQETQYAWPNPNSSLHPTNIIPTVKHDGGSSMLWSCSVSAEAGKIDLKGWWMVLNTSKLLRKIHISLSDFWDRSKASPSRRQRHVSMCWSGFVRGPQTPVLKGCNLAGFHCYPGKTPLKVFGHFKEVDKKQFDPFD